MTRGPKRQDGIAAATVLLAALLVTAGCEGPSLRSGASGRLAINEVVADPEEGGTDWIELIALGDEPVDLSEYTLRDENEDHDPEALPAVVLSPGELYVLAASHEPPADGSPRVTFQLGDEDEIVLARGGEEEDRLSWGDGDAPEGASFGRLPDGTGDGQMLTPTPGEPNAPFDGALPDGELFDTDRVVEVRLELSAEDWQAILDDPLAEVYHPAVLTFDGVVVPEVAVRTKGNSSLSHTYQTGSIRFPFKVDLNYYDEDQELFGERKLNLSPEFKDPSFMREHLGYWVAREIGLPAPRTAFVDLYINGVHMGLYTLIEAVDGDFLDERFDDGDGDLYKPEMASGSLVYRGETIDAYPDSGLTSNEETSDQSAFLQLVGVLHAGDPEGYDSVLDVEEVLRYLAFDAALVNLDSYNGSGHNYYLYEQDGVFQVIPWDLNEAFGLFTCSCDRDGIIHFLVDEPTCGALADRPLVDRLLAVPEHRERYHEILRELLEGPFSVETMAARIAETAELIRPYVAADPTAAFSVEDFDVAIERDFTYPGGRGVAWGLLSFVEERGASIAEQLAGSRPTVGDGEGSCPAFMPGPGGEPPGGELPPEGPCGDGVCDDYEQANPGLCPLDCE